ncbi:MAG: YbaN family protein [Ignavibacteriaceae bacterium]
MNAKSNEITINISPLLKYFYLTSGFILVAIGVAGIFLPILPTTIFLILASVCFLKSSPKANDWLKSHKLLGGYIDNYQNKTGLTLKAKMSNIILLWLSISISAFFLIDKLFVQIILFGVAISVTIHILMIKTKQLETKKLIKSNK